MRLLIGALVMSLLLGGASSVSAQEKDKTKSSGGAATKAPPKTEAGSKEKESRVRGVLPANYRQLGLSDDQRKTIYKIQNEYADKLEEMEKKVEEMKAERNAKYLKTLTKAQRDRLDEIKKGNDKEDKDK